MNDSDYNIEYNSLQCIQVQNNNTKTITASEVLLINSNLS